MTGPDAYLKAMYEAAESEGSAVDWNAFDRIIGSAHKNNESVRRKAPERTPMSISHLLQNEIENAQSMIGSLIEAANSLATALAVEKRARQVAQDAKATLAAGEAELIADAIVMSAAGEGPLAGIAKTSKAYDAALDALKARGYRNGLGPKWQAATVATTAATEAQIVLEQAQVRFSALKHAGELQAAILRASLM